MVGCQKYHHFYHPFNRAVWLGESLYRGPQKEELFPHQFMPIYVKLNVNSEYGQSLTIFAALILMSSNPNAAPLSPFLCIILLNKYIDTLLNSRVGVSVCILDIHIYKCIWKQQN